jgi:hypothetical protein
MPKEHAKTEKTEKTERTDKTERMFPDAQSFMVQDVDTGELMKAADVFMRVAGLAPTEDAIAQLCDAFVPALRIMCERGYDPKGGTWKEGGYMPILIELRKKVMRLWFRCWRRGESPWLSDSTVDLINYGGMAMRSAGLRPWGKWGAPYDFDPDPQD